MADHHQSSFTFPTTAELAPILHSVERMLSGDHEEYFSPTELRAGTWTTRVTGIISLVSSICMIWRAWKRRKDCVFHRLVLGMGIHLTIFGLAKAIGAAAIPSETTNALGSHGTIATCTAQGFLIYVTFLTACSYYVSFSVYAYVGTLSNFKNIGRMESYIHLSVHVYPLISGINLIFKDMFNNSGFGYCFLEVDPIGCGVGVDFDSGNIADSGNDTSCERGHSHKKAQILELLWDVPLCILMIVPTAVMIALYCKVKTKQSVVHIPANKVRQQAIYYLLALYAGILPSAIVHTLEWFGIVRIVAHLFADVMFMFFSYFTIMLYLYFTSGEWGVYEEDDDEEDESSNHLDDLISGQTRNGNGAVEGQEGQAAPDATTPEALPRRRSGKSLRYSFNIFDGTNCSGKFARFIYEGDSDDEREDNLETEKWNAVQDHI